MNHKTFFYILLYSFITLVLFNFLIWKLYTEKILSFKTGDLSRLGYLPELAELKIVTYDLPKRHIELADYKGGQVDVLTIGDSFSNGGGGGRNPYYQDYIASINNYNVLNIPLYNKNDYISTLNVLLNSGFIDKIKPKIILLESVERECLVNIDRIKMGESEDQDKIYSYYNNKSNKNPEKTYFINSGNLKYLLYRFLYNFSKNAFYSQVYQVRIGAPLFTAGDGQNLLFYYQDIKSIPLVSIQSIKKMNDFLNLLAEELERKNIILYFMPAADKYDIYSDYIIDNHFTKNAFFEQLRKLPKKYRLIDTKKILSEEVMKGEKNLYHPDDTHWNWKASKKISEEIKFK